MIKGQCVSNSDEFRNSGKWPELFVAVPRIGERVSSDTGINWQVTSIIHRMSKPFSYEHREPEPFVEIHLYPGYPK